MSLTRKIAHNTILQFTSKVIGTILGLVTVSLMTRALGQAGFGYYSTVMGFLQFFGILVDFGLTLTTAQMLGKSRAQGSAAVWHESTLLSNILGLRVVTAIIFLGLAPLIVLVFPYAPIVKLGIAIGALSFFFMALNQIFLGYFQARLEMYWVSVAEIANRLFLLGAIIACIAFGWGLLAMITAVTLSNLVQFLFLVLPASRKTRMAIAFTWACWLDIWRSTWPIALSIALNLLYLKTDILVLSVYRSPEEVGLYGAAYKVVDVLTTFPVLFAGLLLPLLTQYWQNADRERFGRLIQQGFDALSIVAWPIMVGTVFVGHDLMALIAGESFRESGFLLQLLIWASGIIFFNAVFAHAIVAIDKQKQTIFAYGITAAVGLFGYFLFIPRFGAIGAAAMTIVAELCVALLVFITYVRLTSLRPSIKRWVPIFISCMVMAGALYLAKPWPFLVQLPLAIVVYGAALLLTRGITINFIKDIISLKRYTA